MRIIVSLLSVLLISCFSEKKKSSDDIFEDAVLIEHKITDFHQALKQVYNGFPMNTDSLMDNFFDKDAYYVTYWGVAEPIDSTKSRMHRALSEIKEYKSRLESMNVKVYDGGAYAFFILRQTYSLNGILMDEYLPTTFILERRDNRWVVVHSQRSADFQTIHRFMDVARQREESVRKDISKKKSAYNEKNPFN
jgi:Calcium/calmodulin dependent protein kinase II association domain